MTEKLQIVERTLEQLGATTPERVAELFTEVRAVFDRSMGAATDEASWKQWRDGWLGRTAGALSLITSQWLKSAGPALKPSVGRGLNELRGHIERAIEERRSAIEAQAAERAAAAERIDLTLPGIERVIGTRHLVQQTLEEIQDIFLRLGYAIAEGPEIETAYYNFEALNIPEFHPAREMWDTFYVGGPTATPGKLVLRTHTSPMQIRIMERQPPPVRVIVPGKVYRRDNPDASHLFMFHQIEGLAVDRDLTFADFKGTIEFFVREFLGPKARTRLRPSYFPFTEPSAEVDATCVVCAGRGCRTCKQTGWFEIMGAGMVDPSVYGFVHYDAKKVSGFAFGMGVDRLAILKHGIDDIQVLVQNDARFLRQFP
ncbi:MAG TPA: phenylalanine--tRNA ligase subunit alpha [Candidatus Dormibacteraeota bacterium]|nr:phenylalanine--tRNA ligase subunit alpha [Candidatus Dormibacteraeota bacterium]